jgi:FkbM family methyltransferase
MNYSQNAEQEIILNYFGDMIGTVCDIGANDGKTFSNSLALLERGWAGFLVEPGRRAYNLLCELHEGKKNIYCFNLGIGKESKNTMFFECGELPFLEKDDAPNYTGDLKSNTGLTSYFDKQHAEKFIDLGIEYQTYEIQMLSWKDFHTVIGRSKCDLLCIDTNGTYDYEILTQINLKDIECKMFIVAYSTYDQEEDKVKFIDYATKQGFKLLYSSLENLIFCRS